MEFPLLRWEKQWERGDRRGIRRTWNNARVRFVCCPTRVSTHGNFHVCPFSQQALLHVDKRISHCDTYTCKPINVAEYDLITALKIPQGCSWWRGCCRDSRMLCARYQVCTVRQNTQPLQSHHLTLEITHNLTFLISGGKSTGIWKNKMLHLEKKTKQNKTQPLLQ